MKRESTKDSLSFWKKNSTQKFLIFIHSPLNFQIIRCILVNVFGDVAQLGEHQVRNLGVEGSIPFVSTNNTHNPQPLCRVWA